MISSKLLLNFFSSRGNAQICNDVKYIEDITRGRNDVRVPKKISHELARVTSEIFVLPRELKFKYLSQRVMFFLLYRQKLRTGVNRKHKLLIRQGNPTEEFLKIGVIARVFFFFC